MFVQKTDDFHVKNYQGLLNIIYTILNNGTDEFTFYCDESYNECMNDFNASKYSFDADKLKKYTEEENYNILMDIYQKGIESNNGKM